MIVFQMRKLKVLRVLGEHLYSSAFKKIEIISSLNDCNQACCIFLLLSHSRLHGSDCFFAALRPRMMSYQCRVNPCLTERGFLCVFVYRPCNSCWGFTCKHIPQKGYFQGLWQLRLVRCIVLQNKYIYAHNSHWGWKTCPSIGNRLFLYLHLYIWRYFRITEERIQTITVEG